MTPDVAVHLDQAQPPFQGSGQLFEGHGLMPRLSRPLPDPPSGQTRSTGVDVDQFIQVFDRKGSLHRHALAPCHLPSPDLRGPGPQG